MKKKPIVINSVFRTCCTVPELKRLYDLLDVEERFYELSVSGPRHGIAAVTLTVRQTDTQYFDDLLAEVKATSNEND